MPPFEVDGPLILTTTFRRESEAKRYVVHLLNQGSSWGQHSIYQKLSPLPVELNKQWGFPNQSELRGTWPVRDGAFPWTELGMGGGIHSLKGFDDPLKPVPFFY